MVRASCTALLECVGRKPWNTRKETQLELLDSWRPTTVQVALGSGGKGGCRTGLRITLVQLPLMLITSAWGRGKKGDGCFDRRGVEGGRVCNITRLAILGLTTGHRYRRLLVTTSYPSTAVAPPPFPGLILLQLGKPWLFGMMASADPPTPVLAQLMGWLCYRLDNEVWKSCQAQTGSARQPAPAFRPFWNLFNGSSSPLLNWRFNNLCGRSKKGLKSAKRGGENPNFLNCLHCKDFILHWSLCPGWTKAPPVSHSTLPQCSKSRANRLPTKASAAGLQPTPGACGLAGLGPGQ